MQSLRITLYDLFGYLCPGLVFFLALVIVFWALFVSDAPARYLDLTTPFWIALLVLAYIAGHILHPLYQLVESDKRLAARVSSIISSTSLLPCVAAARTKLKAVAHIDTDDPQLIFRLCDEFVLQQGVRDNQEIYLYRDGFYRGMSTSCFLLSIALLLRALRSPTLLALPTGIYAVTPGMFAFLSITFASSSVFFHFRHLRFLQYRIYAAVDGFVAMK